MRDLLSTTRTYKTRENAVKALDRIARRYGVEDTVRYVIAVNEDGRFAPVVIGTSHLALVHEGVTVAG